MAVPSSGELRLYADIGVELGVPQSDVSLGSMSNSAGFAEPDAMSDFYGYVDALPPSVATNAISNVSTTTFRANGNVTSDGGATITERGFYVGTSSSSPTNNTKYTVSGTTGSYLRNFSGLSDNTTYYCWAFATNSAGTTYGSRVQARTIQIFTPSYLAAGTTNATVFGTNRESSTQTYYLYHTGYYINPYTSAYVAYYSDSTTITTPGFDGFGYWQPSWPSDQRQYCSNAKNEFRTTINNPNDYYTNSYYVNCERTSSRTLTSRENLYTSNLAPIWSTTSSTTRVNTSGNYTEVSGNSYIGVRFNYS